MVILGYTLRCFLRADVSFFGIARASEFLGPEMIPGHLGAVVMSMSARLTNCTIALRAAAELRSSIALKTRR